VRRTRIALPALTALILALTACDGSGGNTEPATASSSTVASTTQPTTTTTTVPAAPTGPTLPKAADGTDIAACYDGSCEVEVRAPLNIPMSPVTGIRKLSVDSISAEGMKVTGTTTTGTNLEVVLFTDPGGYAKSTINGLLFSSIGTVGGAGVLRIAKA
jgi:hypothetical protein